MLRINQETLFQYRYLYFFNRGIELIRNRSLTAVQEINKICLVNFEMS